MIQEHPHGHVEDTPELEAYYQELESANLAPLWTTLATSMPNEPRSTVTLSRKMRSSSRSATFTTALAVPASVTVVVVPSAASIGASLRQARRFGARLRAP